MKKDDILTLKTGKPIYYTEKRFDLTQNKLLGPIAIISLSAIAEIIINGLTPLLYFFSGFDIALILLLFAVLKQNPSSITISAEFKEEE